MEERVSQLAVDILCDAIVQPYGSDNSTLQIPHIEALIRAALRAERERTKEACAQVADAEAESAGRTFGEARDAALNIAAAIRSLD